MAIALFSPPEGLTVLPEQDGRSDAEIIAELTSHRPVTSDRNVWAFWHSGWAELRPWCQRNVIGWVRRLGPAWTVRVLDDVEGSANHLSRFVPDEHFPAAFTSRRMLAGSPPQHLSDLLRLPLLYLYGGVWMDAGMLLFRHLDDVCWRALEDPASPYEMAGMLMPLRAQPGTMLNGFLAARRGSGLLKRWHAVYRALWEDQEGRESAAGFHAHPLLAHLPPLEVQTEQLGCPPLLLPGDALSDHLAHFLCLERLHHLRDPADGFDGADILARRTLLLRAIDHLYYAQRITGWDGRRQYDLLATKVEGGEDDKEKRAEAADFVRRVLCNSAMMKLSHGPPCGLENLASIWDDPAHSDDDVAEGTFAAMLRYGAERWTATNPIEPVRLPPPTVVYEAGVLEPVNAAASAGATGENGKP